MGSEQAGRWTVVIPAKPLVSAKSRLRTPDNVPRSDLALAMLADTVAAAITCDQVGEVVVLTADLVVADKVRDLGATLWRDVNPTGLNASLLAAVTDRMPAGPLAVVTGDLPALRAEDLHDVLSCAIGAPTAFVPDRAGGGTTILTARRGLELTPRFGVRSAARHASHGAVPIIAPPRARHDVDTWSNLMAAARHGLGLHTIACLPEDARSDRWPPPPQTTDPALSLLLAP